MKKTLLRTTVSLLAAAALTLPAAANTLLVNWGGNYFNTSTGDINLFDFYQVNPIPGGILLPYDTSQEISPDGHSRYNTEATSATFYGAVQLTTANGPTTVTRQLRIRHDGASNSSRIHINSDTGNTANHAFAQGFFFWKKEDFLNGFADQEPFSLDHLQEMTLNLSNLRSNSNTAIRFAVQSDGVWYLSETHITGSYFDTKPDPLTLVAPGADQWGIWDPAGSPLNAPPTTFDVNGSMLGNITAVGFYFNGTYTGSNAVILDIESFSVTTIPEPGTAALLGIPVVLLAAHRFKRSRK